MWTVPETVVQCKKELWKNCEIIPLNFKLPRMRVSINGKEVSWRLKPDISCPRS